MLRKGTIVGFEGSWGSGLAGLVLEEHGDRVTVYADSGPLGRALESYYGASCLGNVIDESRIEGREVMFATDSMGLLVGLAPADDIDFVGDSH